MFYCLAYRRYPSVHVFFVSAVLMINRDAGQKLADG